MQNTRSAESLSVQRAMLYLTLAGLTLFVYMAAKGREGFITSLEGWETRDWPFVEGQLASVGTVSSADMLWWPPREQTRKAYFYQVNGVTYHGARYDVHGNAFIGTMSAVRAYKLPINLIVYYDPKDPAEALLKKGVSFDPLTVRRVRWALLGLLMTSVGLVGYQAKKRKSLSPLFHSNDENSGINEIKTGN